MISINTNDYNSFSKWIWLLTINNFTIFWKNFPQTLFISRIGNTCNTWM
jgi:hypothetical protein